MAILSTILMYYLYLTSKPYCPILEDLLHECEQTVISIHVLVVWEKKVFPMFKQTRTMCHQILE